jgi:hypothetical protein
MAVDYSAPEFAGGGFINVATTEGWVVQNLPVDPSSGYPGLSVSFNLGSSSSVLNANVDFGPTPIDNFMGVPGANNYVLAAEPIARNGEGMEDPVIAVEAPPAPSPAALFGGLGFDYVWQPNHEMLEEAVNQCAPGSIARSLTYLKNRYGVPVPDPNNPGTGAANTPDSLVAALDKTWVKPDGTPAGGRAANASSTYPQVLNGSLNYIAAKNLKLGVEHHRIDKTYTTPLEAGPFQSTDGGASHDATNNPTLPWLLDQLEFGSAVGLGYARHHMTNIRGGGVILGRYFVILQDDAKQGEDGGVSWIDGGLSFTWLDWVDDGAPVLSASTLPRITKLNGVNMLIAIHIIPEPGTRWLLLTAALPLTIGRKLRRARRGE